MWFLMLDMHLLRSISVCDFMVDKSKCKDYGDIEFGAIFFLHSNHFFLFESIMTNIFPIQTHFFHK